MEIISIPILQGELPKFLGAICYEGDKNVKRLEFTGAEPNLMYKLDMERTDGMKNVVDLANQNGTLVLEMDGSVYIPAGRYQVQLRTIGEVVRHSNKAFLTVRDAINAENAFGEVLPTEMAQMEVRMTDAMHRAETAANKTEQSEEGAGAAAAQAQDAAERAEAAAKTAEALADVTPASIGAMPGYVGQIPAGDNLDDYKTPGCYKIFSADNKRVKNSAFSGDTGVFLRVTSFAANDKRVLQEAFTNGVNEVKKKWRVRSSSGWSAWKSESEHKHTLEEMRSWLTAEEKKQLREELLGSILGG